MMRLIMNLVVHFILPHKEQNCETLVKYRIRLKMLKKEKKFDPSENASDDLIRAIKLQRTNPEFISFYIFLGTTVQLDDVAMM